MKDHLGTYRGFIVEKEAWYAAAAPLPDNYTDRITFGLYDSGGGTSGEMDIRWKPLGGKSVPQLQCFDDGWSALTSFSDLLVEMALVDGQSITPKQFCSILIRCGFKDDTPREHPYQVRLEDAPRTNKKIREKHQALQKTVQRIRGELRGIDANLLSGAERNILRYAETALGKEKNI